MKEERDELYRQISELKVENTWFLKKTQMMSPAEKCSLVNTDSTTFSIAKQCELLGLSRSRFYYKPRELDQDTQPMIRHLDKLYLVDPT